MYNGSAASIQPHVESERVETFGRYSIPCGLCIPEYGEKLDIQTKSIESIKENPEVCVDIR